MPLSSQRRQQLDDIVIKMADQNAPKEDVDLIVNDFLSKYQNEPEIKKDKTFANVISDPSLGMKIHKAVGTGIVNAFSNIAKTAVQFPQTVIGSAARLPGDIESYRTGQPVKDTPAQRFGQKVMQPIQTKAFGTIKPLSASPQDKEVAQKPGETFAQAAMIWLEGNAPGAKTLFKRPATYLSERLYQSALKPSVEAVEQGVVKTGLKERVWLTKGGVQRAANKIDDLESELGKIFGETKEVNGVETFIPGTASGKNIPTKGIKSFVDPIRQWFETVDTKASKQAIEYIDTTIKDFVEKYGDEIPIEKAQQLKVNTMRLLRNSYGELTTVQKETQKQMARFLKEGIVEQAPEVGNINLRLKNLYALDTALEKASRRINNLNLLGLGTKVGTAVGGTKGAILGLVSDLADRALLKSGAAISLNELTNLASKAGSAARIPIVELLNYIKNQQDGSSSTGIPPVPKFKSNK